MADAELRDQQERTQAFPGLASPALGRVGQWGFAPFFVAPLSAGRAASTPIEVWISLFPTAPLFGLRWFFADMAGMLGEPSEAELEETAVKPLRPQESKSQRAAREQSDLNQTQVRSSGRPAAAASEAYDEAISLDEVGVGAISDLSALGGVAAAFSSDLGESASRENAALNVTRLAPARRRAAPAPEKTQPADAREEASAPKAKARAKAPRAETAATSRSSASAKKPKAPQNKAADKKPTDKKPTADSAKAARPKPTKKKGQPFATYDARPPHADDLTLIKGVGAKLAAVLNDRGVYTFDQIAAFNAAAYQWLDETLGAFKGRGVRDDWAGQAKTLKSAKR